MRPFYDIGTKHFRLTMAVGTKLKKNDPLMKRIEKKAVNLKVKETV